MSRLPVTFSLVSLGVMALPFFTVFLPRDVVLSADHRDGVSAPSLGGVTGVVNRGCPLAPAAVATSIGPLPPRIPLFFVAIAWPVPEFCPEAYDTRD